MDNNQFQPQGAPVGYDPNTGAPIYANGQAAPQAQPTVAPTPGQNVMPQGQSAYVNNPIYGMPSTPYKRKINFFAVVTTIIYMISAFLPAFKFNIMASGGFLDLSELYAYAGGKTSFSWYSLVRAYEKAYAILGMRGYYDSDYELVRMLMYGLVGLVILWGILGLVFGLVKQKVPVIVFGCFALIHAIGYAFFTLVVVMEMNDGYMKVASVGYGIPVMLLAALLYLISGCVYKTKEV